MEIQLRNKDLTITFQSDRDNMENAVNLLHEIQKIAKDEPTKCYIAFAIARIEVEEARRRSCA